MKTNKKQWIFTIVWFIAFISTLEFLRYTFGLFPIAGFFLIFGLLGQWLLRTRKGPN